jgi:hypothetical protein
MKHFAPCPITDDRDYWLMVGDGHHELLSSIDAVEREIADSGPWWDAIWMLNCGHGICRDVTDLFSQPEDIGPSPQELLREHYARVR